MWDGENSEGGQEICVEGGKDGGTECGTAQTILYLSANADISEPFDPVMKFHPAYQI